MILDLDGTLWDHPDISSLSLPFEKVDDRTLADSRGVRVHLFEGVREFLQHCRALGLKLAVASWNVYEKAYEALRVFDIDRFFDVLTIEPYPRKELMIEKILSYLGLDIEDVLYIDDRPIHLEGIRARLGGVAFLQAWKDFKDFYELSRILNDILCIEL